ncbi:DUF342 domain-containing protein [Colwellia sp. C1TZA3]|uniref:DUF342 domain-containing protein n=1 Tax=Colwellia sp. C1TZA3 TaxID=2508879 RepID=UPI0011B9749C|nr:FapA family protein [Colwellia sp. C1TZA3]TWX72862.1 DUF342 domain-containing protein [Colwellia sp. C1TZA3]
MSKVSLVSNDKNNIDLVLSPIKTQTPLTEADIYELIENSQYSHLYVVKGNIKNAIAELKSVLKPLQENRAGREVRYQILERRDATFLIEIADDNMSASAAVTTALGGQHMSAKAIFDAAQAANVCKGFSKEQLVKLAKQAAKEPAGSMVKCEIAHGKLPTDGNNAYIKLLVESAQDRILKPKNREDGSVDMRDLGDIICVKIGDPLAQKIPLTNGIPGYTVTGKVLDSTPGTDIDIYIGEGTTLSQKNSSVLVSTLVGLPRIIENGMEVDSVYHLKNVDVSTGHVKFKGSVIIDGNVGEGMKVVTTGDISIGGFVESAMLDAGGDITIGKGIIGKKQEVEAVDVSKITLSANIKAGGKVFAKYSQYADITCDSLRIENQIMHNIVKVNKTVWVGREDKANGKLIAGYISAGKSVHAGTIGATAGSMTIITFADRMHDCLAKMVEIDESVKTESATLLELKSAVIKLKNLPKAKAKPEVLKKVISTYRYHTKKVAAALSEKESYKEKLQAYMTSGYVEANERVYHGVQVIIGEYHDKTRREYGPSRFIYKEQKVHIEPLVSV